MSDMRDIFHAVRANRERLKNCPGHLFVEPYVFGKKMRCCKCDGEMRGEELSSYMDGYIAAGGDPVAVWPAYKEKPRS